MQQDAQKTVYAYADNPELASRGHRQTKRDMLGRMDQNQEHPTATPGELRFTHLTALTLNVRTEGDHVST